MTDAIMCAIASVESMGAEMAHGEGMPGGHTGARGASVMTRKAREARRYPSISHVRCMSVGARDRQPGRCLLGILVALYSVAT